MEIAYCVCAIVCVWKRRRACGVCVCVCDAVWAEIALCKYPNVRDERGVECELVSVCVGMDGGG